MRAPTIVLVALWIAAAVCPAAGAAFQRPDQAPRLPSDKEHRGVFVVDGSFVHNVGELQLNITNWGLIGSQPGTWATYASAPSAMWPAGSGVDYLFAAGIWVGGIKSGVPLVSTGQFENEFFPTSHPLDTIYRTFEGDLGGSRYPFPDPDDDGDGRENEDPKNGLDDDHDGLIDEDFAAISQQEFRLRMYDNLPIIQEQWPDHDPLGLEVTQESFQWSSEELEDVVGFDYTIRNVGNSVIEDLAVGFFADPDIGPRDGASISIDDMIGFYEGTVTASDGVPLSLSIAYMYDCDGDDGRSPGYIGFVAINSSQPPLPVSINCFRFFTATASFENGGDPSTDAERYTLLTSSCRDVPRQVCTQANDYRLLMAFQPPWGALFGPGQSGKFQLAIVMGDGLDDLIHNASQLILTYYGQWFDRDLDPSTGVLGRERKICIGTYPGSVFEAFLDCGYPSDCLFRPPLKVTEVDKQGCAWINGDCAFEQSRGVACGTCWSSEGNACTGVAGKEFNVRWLSRPIPPPPRMRVLEGNNRVDVLWASDAEDERDLETGLPLFESYRVWRADGWDRPPGTSVETGPPTESWFVVAEFDRVDEFENRVGNTHEVLPLGPNTGLDVVAYTPSVLRSGSAAAEEYAGLSSLLDEVIEAHPQLTPRSRVRYRNESGEITTFGQEFPALRSWECCPAELDTLLMGKLGLQFYRYEDDTVTNGFFYFYAVTFETVAYDTGSSKPVVVGYGPGGRPRANFQFAEPRSSAQSAEDYDQRGPTVYVIPNPATTESLAEFNQLHPNAEDPTGLRVEFRNLPAARNTVRIFTVSGDLVATLHHDGRNGSGSLAWNLVSRRGQEIVSGIYLFSVESSDSRFDRTIGRFVVIR
jgi:hypothetical protein